MKDLLYEYFRVFGSTLMIVLFLSALGLVNALVCTYRQKLLIEERRRHPFLVPSSVFERRHIAVVELCIVFGLFAWGGVFLAIGFGAWLGRPSIGLVVSIVLAIVAKKSEIVKKSLERREHPAF